MEIARLSGAGQIVPLRDGQAQATVSYGGKTTHVQILVRGSHASVPISFSTEVEPLLTRAGCNQGACHGSQYGKGGFKLSLAGFDPDLDYANIARQGRGRRIAVVDPEQSLLLQKPAMRVPHGGGRRLEPGSADYAMLIQWLRDGAPGPQKNDPQVASLDVYPKERILRAADGAVPLVVVARYDDGTTRDVTPHARLQTLNDAVAACTPDGIISAAGRGQTAIMVRYGGQATVSTIIAPYPVSTGGGMGRKGDGENKSVAARVVVRPEPVESERIDALVEAKQRQLCLLPSPLCSDQTFVRRVFFDLIGTAPTPDEITKFCASTDPHKREQLIDTLLERPEYADYWTLKWGDLLRSNRTTLGPKGMWSFTNWIREQMRVNRPADGMVHDLIMAKGSTFTDGPSNFYRVATNPQDLAETTSQVFLGVRMQCTRCHHHPFEKWSQQDYYQFAAFFARVGLKGSRDFGLFGNEQVVMVRDGGEVTHPKTGAVMKPEPLGVRLASLESNPDAGGDRRTALADWLVAPTNRLFARNIANRYWAYMLGKGIVNPIDDQRVTNPPSNDALLNYLADELVKAHYDLKHLLRIICASRAYQRCSDATRDNRQDELFFTHYLPKRLPAEALLDSVDSACGTREKFPELPLGTRAIQLPDPNVGSEFLDIFGRPARLIACECERGTEANLSQTLRMLNGELVNNKVVQSDGRVAKLLASGKSNDDILNEIYLRALGRPPDARERKVVIGLLAFSSDRKEVFQDLLLTLLNSKEFLFNH
jgi:hypothetical protein